VCRKCERWNLTPLEERWEAIEECERLFTSTRMRASTDNIGLAKLGEGLELVRIGQALRPEMAAWRYGDQFGRRRTKHIMVTGATAVTVGGLLILGPATGVIAGGGWGMWQAFNGIIQLYEKKRVRLKLVLPGERELVVLRKNHLEHTALVRHEGDWLLNLSYDRGARTAANYEMREFRGDEAVRVAGLVLPKINAKGASKAQVQEAVRLLERHGDSRAVFEEQARLMRSVRTSRGAKRDAANIALFPIEQRLALEMAAHEEQERRALEGELALLEAAWRQAEEVAKIADDMFLPQATVDEIEALRKRG
jgi:hypothetical protein